MLKIFVFGLCGKMGRTLASCASANGCEITGGLDMVKHESIPTFANIQEVNVPFDIIIDFSRPEALDGIIALAKENKRGVVLSTTGYSDSDKQKIRDLATFVPVLCSGNMSVGVNTILALVEEATRKLGDSFDVEIIEKHHNQKVDAPSGTAKMLASSVTKARGGKGKLIYGREGLCPREKGDIGMHAVRGGTIVGEHDVIFAGEDETITISHTALSRKIFANGAFRSARFLSTAPPNLYSMKNVLQ